MVGLVLWLLRRTRRPQRSVAPVPAPARPRVSERVADAVYGQMGMLPFTGETTKPYWHVFRTASCRGSHVRLNGATLDEMGPRCGECAWCRAGGMFCMGQRLAPARPPQGQLAIWVDETGPRECPYVPGG